MTTCVKCRSVLLVSALSILLGACSSNDQYLEAGSLPPITVPDSLDSETLGEIYRIPEGDGRLTSGELEDPLPPVLSGRQEVSEPRVQSFGNKSWLMVPEDASVTWSQVLIFLRSRNIPVTSQDIFSATLETGWVKEGVRIPNTAFRYRLHLEAGFQSDLTELHLVNIEGRVQDPIATNTQWPAQAENSSHQQWLLKQIARSISQQKFPGDSLIASGISLEKKVFINNVQGEPVVELREDPQRVYNALENALGHESLVLYDQDKDQRIFHMDRSDIDQKKEKKGITRKAIALLSNVVGGGEQEQKVSPYPLEQVLTHLPSDDAVSALFGTRAEPAKRLSKVPGYLLVMRAVDNKQRLYVRDGYGRPLSPAVAKALLDEVKEHLF